MLSKLLHEASDLVATGRMLMEKRIKLFWSPCASHYCLYLVLEDTGELSYNTITMLRKSLLIFIGTHGLLICIESTLIEGN